MGRDAQAACRDCRIAYYLGYGSYSSWLDSLDTPEAFDAFDDSKGRPSKSFYGNVNWRRVLEEHRGHDLVRWSDDWAIYEGGNLHDPGPYMSVGPVLVADYDSYRKINLDI